MSDRLVGNYCGANLFHRDKRRKTKTALSLEKACVVLINFYQPPIMCASFHIPNSIVQSGLVRVHPHTDYEAMQLTRFSVKSIVRH